MKIIIISDIHGNVQVLDFISEKLRAVDLIIVSGDITHFGKENEADFVIKYLSNFNPNILAVPGNCDFPEVGEYLTAKNINLDNNIVNFSGLQILGLGGSIPCPSKTPFERNEEEIKAILQKLISKIDKSSAYIFVFHQPPINTIVDRISTGEHIGSESIRDIIENSQAIVTFSGHVHDGFGIDSIGETKLVNPGPIISGKYAYLEYENNEIKSLDIKSIID